ncbi:PGC-1 and ERR-induced regulator in muscle protein 1 isoform X2 [Choloepus didactylus]|nr:PGC-1 and ERR-induced regulator in muscle protein 1 isoform X2 [Choloepus didactylus]
MQRLLQGPAAGGPTSSPAGELPPCPEPPGHSASTQGPPSSPGAPRSPGRKKKLTAGAKKAWRAGAPAPVPPQPGSPLLLEARPGEGPCPAESRIPLAAALLGKGLAGAAAELKAGARLNELGPDSAQAPDPMQVPQQDLSTPAPMTEQGRDVEGVPPRAELHTVSTPAQEAQPKVALSTPSSKPQPVVALSTLNSKPDPDLALPTPGSKTNPDVGLSTPGSKLQTEVALSTSNSKPNPDVGLSTPSSKPDPDLAPSTSISKPNPDLAPSTSGSKPQSELAPSTPSSKLNLDMALSTPISMDKPEVDSTVPVLVAIPHKNVPHPASQALPDLGVSTPGPRVAVAAPCWPSIPRAAPDVGGPEPARTAELAPSPVRSSQGHQAEPQAEPPAGPAQVPRKKKVRFSVAEPSPEEPGPGEAQGPPLPAAVQPLAPRTAVGGRGGPGAWDAVAVAPWTLQPRVHGQLPPPASSSLRGSRPGSSFALTVPEVYDFLFCDTIEEEAEDAEEAAAHQALADVQWPDTCEFFFWDCQAQRSRPRGGCSQDPAPLPGDAVPISIPEAYEHFFGEEGWSGELEPAALRQLQAVEPSPSGPQHVGPGVEPSPAAAQEPGPAVRWAGGPRGPLPSFTFSQNDMCLVFVAFATWAVRTSDLHAPDAWKTVLLANIGTISAIRYFRRQVEGGRPGPGPSS